jgi:signal transduction histidine kinase/HAMP domain-containing protein
LGRPVKGQLRRLRIVGDWWVLWTGQNMSLAFKLAVPVVVTTIVLVAVMANIVVATVQNQIQDAYDQQAKDTASGVEAMFAQHPNETAQINDYLARLVKARPDLVAVRILNLDDTGTVIASSDSSEVGRGGIADPEELKAIWGGYAIADHQEGSLLITVQPLKVGDVIFGAVFISSTTSAQAAATRSITWTIAIVGTVAIIVDSIFVLSALYLGIIRRTRRMQRAVEAVGRGDTSVRLPEGPEARGRDEIFNLARSVDQMIESLDERQRGDALIRRLGQRALEGATSGDLVAEGLAATCDALGLDSCIFATVSEDGSMGGWVDASGDHHMGGALPVWVFALTRVAVEARKAVVADRQGQHSRFVDAAATTTQAPAVVVPLPRTSKAGQAIIAIAPVGETIPDGGLAVLDAVAATIAESLHMQAAEAARAESAVKSKVMAAVSHEMRNPLNSILGFTGLVLGPSNENLTDKQRKHLGHVQTSATTMLTLVNNYLDLARLRDGSVATQYEMAKLEPLVAEVVGAMQPMAAGRKVEVRTSVSPDAQVRVDPTKFRQILTNLVSNAVKFTPEGGRVAIRARADKETYRVVVSDTGVGIPRDQASLVFTEFARIDAGPLAASKGTGLGLALTRAFVNTLGGSIRFYSRPGRGTTFVVILPRDGRPERKASAA